MLGGKDIIRIAVIAATLAFCPGKALSQSKDPATWRNPQAGELQWVSPEFLPRSGYVVQLGVFSSRGSVERSVQRLGLGSVKLFAVPVPHGDSERYHLLYGPYQYRDNADIMGAKLRELTGEENWVRTLDSLH